MCDGDSSCGGNTKIHCGTGDCRVNCTGNQACHGAFITAPNANSFQCNGCDPLELTAPPEFSAYPTSGPTNSPTTTISPTKAPSNQPSTDPTQFPSKYPTNNPTTPPTTNPTSVSSTKSPSAGPINAPSDSPTRFPANDPTFNVTLPHFIQSKSPTTDPSFNTTFNHPTTAPSPNETSNFSPVTDETNLDLTIIAITIGSIVGIFTIGYIVYVMIRSKAKQKAMSNKDVIISISSVVPPKSPNVDKSVHQIQPGSNKPSVIEPGQDVLDVDNMDNITNDLNFAAADEVIHGDDTLKDVTVEMMRHAQQRNVDVDLSKDEILNEQEEGEENSVHRESDSNGSDAYYDTFALEKETSFRGLPSDDRNETDR